MCLLECEIDEGGHWRSLTIDDAIEREASLGKKLQRMRCPVCKGRVKTHRKIKGLPRAHFEHFEKHAWCTHCKVFDGVVRDHPGALL
jgi:hypothetical protein